MSSALYLEKLRDQSSPTSPYYIHFDKSVGGSPPPGIGNIYSNVPDFQRGYGILVRHGYPTARAQLGSGLGSFFRRLFNFSKPFLKRGLKEAVNIGTNVVRDVALDGADVKTALKNRVSDRLNEVLPGVADKLLGSGRKRRSTRRAAVKRVYHVRKRNKRVKKRGGGHKKYPALDLIP